jgi:phenylalanine ammonia-lyase
MTFTTSRRRSSTVTVYAPKLFGDLSASAKTSATHGVVHVVASNGIIDKTTTLLAKFVESHKELEAYKSDPSLFTV